jgi:uncharacterized membrane protein
LAAAAVGLALLALALAAALARPPHAAAAPDEPVARAVLFYSPTCEHCRALVREGLPPILERYGEQLQILPVDSTDEPGMQLFRSTMDRLEVPLEAQGVPSLVIGDRILSGGTDIEEQLPLLVARHLDRGGVGWPSVPGLAAFISGGEAVVTSSPGRLLGVTERPDRVLDRLAQDGWRNVAALVLLAAMAAAVGFAVVRLVRRRHVLSGVAAGESRAGRLALTGLLIAAGLAVAGFLSYASATGSAALCDPLGSCGVVQQSAYARLFGVLPVAYLGLAGYVLIAIAFAVAVLARGAVGSGAIAALFGLTLAGTLFSLYLTAVEPFLIGETCLWCLTSAGIMTALLLLAAERVGLAGASTECGERTAGGRPSGGCEAPGDAGPCSSAMTSR